VSPALSPSPALPSSALKAMVLPVIAETPVDGAVAVEPL